MSHTPPYVTVGMPSGLIQRIADERERLGIPGAAVALFDARDVVFHGGFGHASIGGFPVRADHTAFRAASITKLFTATLFLQAIERGRFTLDDPLPRRMNGQATGIFRGMTARMLLTHSSRLPTWGGGLSHGVLPQPPCNRVPLRRMLEDIKPLASPGQRIVYSNAGYALLGQFLAFETGRPFESIAADLLTQLGMGRSEVALNPTLSEVATPYFGGWALQVCLGLTAAGGLLTTATDLSQFGRMVLNFGKFETTRFLRASTVKKQMLRPLVKNRPSLESGFGLGFQCTRWRDYEIAFHSGGFVGVSTLLALLPEPQVGVAVLANVFDREFVYQVAEWAMDAWGRLRPAPPDGGAAGLSSTVTPSELQQFADVVVGRYNVVDASQPGSLPDPPPIEVFHDGGGVFRIVVDELRIPALLYPDGPRGRFRTVHPLGNTGRVLIEIEPGPPAIAHLWLGTAHAMHV